MGESTPQSISGFVVIPIKYSKAATHYLYAKAHQTTKKKGLEATGFEVLPRDRTLFLVNVPPDATEREISLLFKFAGIVEKVVFDHKMAEQEALDALNNGYSSDSNEEDEEDEDEMQVGDEEGQAPKKRKKSKKEDVKPKLEPLPDSEIRAFHHTGQTAFVVFLDSSSMEAALKPSPKPHAWPRSSEPTGLARYKALHSACRPALDTVRAYAESSIALYDWQERQKKKESQYKKGEAIVDEDGFTLVTRGGAYGQTLGGGVGVASKKFQDTGETSARSKGKKKKNKGSETESFYAFQKHEKKRQGISYSLLP